MVVIKQPSTPEVTDFSVQTITGTADPKAKINVTYEDQQYQTTADAKGFWSINNPIIGAGSVTIVAINAQGVASQEISLAQLPSLPSTPLFSQVGDYLEGTADPHVTVVVRHEGVEYSVEPDENGNWSLLNPLVPGTAIEVFARNEFGLESPTIVSYVPPDPVIPPIPQVVPYAPEVVEVGKKLTGTAMPHAQIVAVSNSQEYTTIADEDGNWSLENPIAQGGTLEIYLITNEGLKSPSISLVIPVILPEPPQEPEESSYILFELVIPNILKNDEQLAGQAMPYGKIVILANDVEYITYADENGEWWIENPIAQGGFLTLYSENIAGERSESISIAKLNFPVIEEQQASIEEILVLGNENTPDTLSILIPQLDNDIDVNLLLQGIETPSAVTPLNPLFETPVQEIMPSSPIVYSTQDLLQPAFAEQNWMIG